jgi:hypothetical protein
VPIYPLVSLYADNLAYTPQYAMVRWEWDGRTLIDPFTNEAQIKWVTDIDNTVPNGDVSFLSFGDFEEPEAQWIFSSFVFDASYTIIGRNHEIDGPQRNSDWIRFHFVMPTVTPIEATPQPTPTEYPTPPPSNVTEWQVLDSNKDFWALLGR